MKTLKYAIRFLMRQKAFTIINITGLALSLACCIVLTRYLHRELTVDSHAIKPETIMVISRESDIRNSIISTKTIENTMGKAFADDISKNTTESCVYLIYPKCSVNFQGKSYTANILAADSLLLNFFNYSVEGDRNGMHRNDGCWISRRYMGKLGLASSDVIGSSVNASNMTFEVVGVFDEPDCKTTFSPDFIFANVSDRRWSRTRSEWLRVPDGFDIEEFNERATSYRELPEEEQREKYRDHLKAIQMNRWSDLYFNNVQDGENYNLGNSTMCWVLAAVLCIILIIGMTNFVNLYLVYWQRRMREEGVRKVYGQKTRHLFMELWTELMLMVAASVFIAWTMVELSAKWINPMMGHDFGWSWIDLAITTAMLILLPILALCYPLIRQNSRPLLQSLQERVGSGKNIKSRTAVLAFQYLLTFSLLTMALWTRNQLSFLIDSPAGFDTDNILITKPFKIVSGYTEDGGYKSNWREASETVKLISERLKECPAIEKTTMSTGTPLQENFGDNNVFNDKNESCILRLMTVSRQWLDIFNIKLKQGSLKTGSIFDLDKDNDGTQDPFVWIANEEALRRLGYSSIENAHARSEQALWLTWDPGKDGVVEYGKDAYPIGGVVESHYTSHKTLGPTPLLFMIEEPDYKYDNSILIIRSYPGKNQEALDFYKKVCGEICPNEELEYHWLNDDVNELYNDDRLIAEIYTLFSWIAIAICCLGLLGLSMFDIRQRYREVAIRKAHGAKRKHLYILLGKKYLWVLMATFAASIPITIIAIKHYTKDMAECAPLSPWIYIASLMIVSAITAITIATQLEKASRINVSVAMKTE